MISSKEKDELLASIRDMRSEFVDLKNHFSEKPFIDQEKLNSILKTNDIEVIGFNMGIRKKIKEIEDKFHETIKKLNRVSDRCDFYFNHLIKDTHNYDVLFSDDMTHSEDDLLHKCSEIIATRHNYKIEKVEMHKRIDGIEFDCILHGETGISRDKRTIGLEFKDSNILKALDQGFKRNTYTNAQYVISNESVWWVLKNALPMIQTLSDNKIGLIAVERLYKSKTDYNTYIDYPVLLLESSINRKAKFAELTDYAAN